MARRLKQERLARGLSQEKLADLAELNRNYVGMLERKENSPTVETLEKLADALGIDMMSLFDADALDDSELPAGGPEPGKRRSRAKRRT